ncbi:MAG: hypothetical protein GKR88_00320 [Flavobacteriaceae bacterium]|nr:MAG: hypothetical protein GKR88_00320 [Flavobacteriaceae bacterium]
MKKKILSAKVFLLVSTIAFILACTQNNDEQNDQLFDCPALQANVGSICFVQNQQGVLNANCECEVTVTYDCPTLQLNIGDSCTTANGMDGKINANCECEAENTTQYDCPALQLNIGDTCYIQNQQGTVNSNCDCEV